jgi:hypothetical protein
MDQVPCAAMATTRHAAPRAAEHQEEGFRSRLSVSPGVGVQAYEGREVIVAGRLDEWPSSLRVPARIARGRWPRAEDIFRTHGAWHGAHAGRRRAHSHRAGQRRDHGRCSGRAVPRAMAASGGFTSQSTSRGDKTGSSSVTGATASTGSGGAMTSSGTSGSATARSVCRRGSDRAGDGARTAADAPRNG